MRVVRVLCKDLDENATHHPGGYSAFSMSEASFESAVARLREDMPEGRPGPETAVELGRNQRVRERPNMREAALEPGPSDDRRERPNMREAALEPGPSDDRRERRNMREAAVKPGPSDGRRERDDPRETPMEPWSASPRFPRSPWLQAVLQLLLSTLLRLPLILLS
ncbi:hypothetical protein FJT64_012963 [Amphibalanus amphitrite]|uniref:Uncharacterized protein n=1 Tax=Amphibalanus amphitrite TaxID=1232801 RepID=A0A6A4VBM4_AMPAM|nr:hypothetical protein FJT64_012963 [Amphibalanus amphitrite]